MIRAHFLDAVLGLTVLPLLGAAAIGCSSNDADLGESDDELRVCADGPTVKGIDVSHHNDRIDWARVKSSGQAFAFMRVSDGSHLDTQFKRNWAESKRVGVLRGAYQYFRPGDDPSEQADLFIRKIRDAGGMQNGDLPPVLDVETSDGEGSSTVRSRSLAWLNRVQQALGIKPIVYTGNNMSNVVGNALASYTLWVPNYGASCPLTPSGWRRWTFWQKSESGDIPGVNGDCDTDVFNGTLEQLKALTLGGAGAGTPPPSVDPGQTPPPAVSPGGVWQPAPGTTWQWQLSGTVDTSLNVQMYDIDLFDNSASTIGSLRSSGKKVICYFSAGTSENWRPDYSKFAASDKGSALDDWPGERWLNVNSQNVRNVMLARLDLAKQKGCDGVEPDNVDGYTNSNGLGLTKANQLDYLHFIEREAHARGLSVGLKNALDLVPSLVASFDWALDEQCVEYGECGKLRPFIDAHKAVFHTEYSGTKSSVCGNSSRQGFSTLLKHLDLGSYRVACP